MAKKVGQGQKDYSWLFYSGQEVRVKSPHGVFYGRVAALDRFGLRLWIAPFGDNNYVGMRWVKPID